MGALNDKLVDELQKLIAEFETLAKSAISAAGEHAGSAAEELSSGLSRARAGLASFEKDVTHELKRGAGKTDSYVHDQPWMAIGIAAAAAFLLGIAVSRRE